MLKGASLYHPLGNVSALNQLGMDFFTGTDELLRVIRDPAQQAQFHALQGEYVARVPHDIGVTEAQNIQKLPATLFKNSWIIMNEGDLANRPASEQAALATTAIQNIQAADPTRQNKIILSAGSQHAGTDYVEQVLDLLPAEIRALIDGLAWHFYPQSDPNPGGGIYDENRLRNFLSVVCPFTAEQGFSKAWLPEWGWSGSADNWRVGQEIPKWVAVMDEFPILKRHCFYGANVPYYQLLVNPQGLTHAGLAFKAL